MQKLRKIIKDISWIRLENSRGPWSKVRETYLHVSWITDHGA
jgi:hypothetical protein